MVVQQMVHSLWNWHVLCVTFWVVKFAGNAFKGPHTRSIFYCQFFDIVRSY